MFNNTITDNKKQPQTIANALSGVTSVSNVSQNMKNDETLIQVLLYIYFFLSFL